MIPNTIRVPFMGVEIDASRAVQGASVLKFKALLVGQRLSSGTISSTRIDPITNADQAAKFYGAGSMLANMAAKWFENNRSTEIYAASLVDEGDAVAAAGTIAVTGPATANGVMYLYVAGQRIAVPVVSGDTATAIATAIAAAITAKTSLPVTASANTGTVTVTAKNKGTVGNTIDIRFNYNRGEEFPAGISVAITDMASGATDPSLSGVISLLGDEWYQVIACPYTDTTNLTAIEAELAARYGYDKMLDGIYVTSKKDTQGNLSTFGNSRNSPHVNCWNAQKVPNTTAEVCASFAAVLAYEFEADPNSNVSTVPIKGILPPSRTERFTFTENNILLYDGISTFSVDSSDTVRIQRAITMYQKNSSGADDEAYLDIATMMLNMYLRYDFRTTIQRKYARARLANDASNIRAGIQVITPKIGAAEAIAKFRQWEEAGYVENIEQFIRDLVCVRDADNPNRLNWLLPPDLVNHFLVGAATIQFRL